MNWYEDGRLVVNRCINEDRVQVRRCVLVVAEWQRLGKAAAAGLSPRLQPLSALPNTHEDRVQVRLLAARSLRLLLAAVLYCKASSGP